jgi:hypothetical protein
MTKNITFDREIISVTLSGKYAADFGFDTRLNDPVGRDDFPIHYSFSGIAMV